MAKIDKTPFPQSKKLKKADGTIAYVWDGNYIIGRDML